jgi:hypothetical protein
MKASEFITEMQIGRYASGGTVPTKDPLSRSSIKKNSKLAYDIVKSVNNAPTSRDKIEILSSLTAGKTTNKIVIIGPNDKRYAFQSYDKGSGKLTVSLSTTLFNVDVDSLEFLGKERIISNTTKKWLFKTDHLEPIGKMDTKPSDTKKGRPLKPDYSSMPTRLW